MKSFLVELRRRNVVRVAIFYAVASWLILQVADVLFGLLSVPDWSLRFVLGILLLGFPIALIFSWVYELTPEGIKRERDIDRSRSITRTTGRKLDAATMGLLALTIGLVVWDRLTRDSTPVMTRVAEPTAEDSAGQESGDLSIAVLPFANMSDDRATEYFSDGLAEELLNLLAKVPDFRVAGRTSSFAFKGKSEDLRIIGEKLNVAHILEGSVRKQDDRIRVTAQLINAGNGYHLWSETYDDRMEDVFAIQDAIATAVVRELKTTLLPADRAVIESTATADVEAYRHYLKGQSHVRVRTPEALVQALNEFQQASLIDPNYAPPYAGMATVYALMDNYGYRSLGETGPVVERAIDRALALDPDNSDAWAAKGLYISQRGEQAAGAEWRAEALKAFEKAIELNPNNAKAYMWMSTALAPDDKASLAVEKKAYELDPLSPIIIHRLAAQALQLGRLEEARARIGELESEAPGWFLTHMRKADLEGLSGRLDRRARALEAAYELNPGYAESALTLANLYFDWGEVAAAEELVDATLARSFVPKTMLNAAFLRAEIALAQGDPQSALARYVDLVADLPPTPDGYAQQAVLMVATGDAAGAQAVIEDGLDIFPPYPDRIESDQEGFPIYALAIALRLQGDDAGAAKLAQALDEGIALQAEQVEFSNWLPMVRAWMAGLRGETEAARAGFREAMDLGYRENAVGLRLLVPHMADDPEWQALMAEMEALIARDRSRYEAGEENLAGLRR